MAKFLRSDGSVSLSFRSFSIILTVFFRIISARDIVFPPVAAIHPSIQPLQYPFTTDDPTIETGGIAGLTTFANLPYVHCLSEDAEISKYDIAFLGAPFDTVGLFNLYFYHLVSTFTLFFSGHGARPTPEIIHSVF